MIKKCIIILLLFVISCSDRETSKLNSKIDTPENIYIEANNYFKNKNYDLSLSKFKELNKLFPLSNEAIQAEIMIGFINYIKMDYEAAHLQFSKIIQKYPAYKNIDYAFYMKAMCNYEQITHEGLDGEFTILAIDEFNQLINRFPQSKYAKDSRQKIILVKSNIAAKHMSIGRFYLKELKYTAALNRFKKVVDEYSMTKFTPEALHRMVEIYTKIGMIEEAKKHAAVLGYNYPESQWYKYSYNLINNKKEKSNYFEKFSKIFINDK